MRIVVLDGWTLNPGDLNWEGLERLGTLTVHDRVPADQVVARARGAEAVFTNKTPLRRETLEQLPGLRYVGVLATGFDVVDLSAASERGVTVTNIPTYGTRSVAQMVFAHLLNLTQHVAEHAEGVRAGRWSHSEDFCYWDQPLVELSGLTLGIVGFGRIGHTVAMLGRGFGMRVLAHDLVARAEEHPEVDFMDLESLLRQADVVSLHLPLTPQTRGIINAGSLGLMKPTAYLINTSRGPLVRSADLAAALNAGRLAGAGLDVLEQEPPPADSPLLTARNCYVTPHIAWATRAARSRLMDIAVRNLQAFLAGRPENVVNAPAAVSR